MRVDSFGKNIDVRGIFSWRKIRRYLLSAKAGRKITLISLTHYLFLDILLEVTYPGKNDTFAYKIPKQCVINFDIVPTQLFLLGNVENYFLLEYV